MSDYNKYVEAVNKIFEIIQKMRVNYPEQDNIALIDAIEENKQIVINSAKLFNNDQQKNSEQAANSQDGSVAVTESLEG